MSNYEQVLKFIRNTKIKAVEHMGGCCKLCGYKAYIQALEFHHLDPLQKDFAISGGSHSWVKIQSEIEKCVLLCANCHRETHAGLTIYSGIKNAE